MQNQINRTRRWLMPLVAGRISTAAIILAGFVWATGLWGCYSAQDKVQEVSNSPLQFKQLQSPSQKQLDQSEIGVAQSTLRPSRSVFYGGPSKSPEFTPFEKSITGMLTTTGAFNCQPDQKLVSAARHHAAQLAGRESSKTNGDLDFLRFSMLYFGNTDYRVWPFSFEWSKSGQQQLIQFVETHRQSWTHFGLGAYSDENKTTIVFVGVQRLIRFEPIVLSMQKNIPFTIGGHVLKNNIKELQLFWGTPDGTVLRPGIRRVEHNRFEVEVIPDQSGKYIFELLIDVGNGVETVSWFPVYVNVAPDNHPVILPEDHTIKRGKTDTAFLFELVNRARVRENLSSLLRDPRLDAIAEIHTNDMVTRGFFGHRSKQSGTLANRLKAAGIYPKECAENIAMASSILRVHRNLLDSPSHRAKLLKNNFTHIGIGIQNSPQGYIVTEILARY